MIVPALKFLLRTALFYGLVYACWHPLQHSYIEFIAAGAERIFRLVDDPPLITSLVANGNRIDYFSFVTGFQQKMGDRSFGNLHLYFVTAVALVLGIPQRSGSQRLRLVLSTLALFVLVSLAICVVGIKTNADDVAKAAHGLTLLGARERAFLDWANRTLLMVGMLVFPAYLFFVGYFYRWQEGVAPPSSSAGRPGWHAWTRGGRLRLGTSVVAVLLVCGGALALWTRGQNDPMAYLDGWGKIMQLNPSFAPAKVNVALQLQRQGRLDEAIALYREALRIDPELTLAHFNLGNALRESGSYQAARQHYEHVVRKEPGHAGARRNLGHTLDGLKLFCEALPHFERSVQLQPSYLNEKSFAANLRRHRETCRP